MSPASLIPAFIQVDFLLAEFFASIAITMIARSACGSPTQSSTSVVWHAFLLFGALNTILCYRRVKQAARGGEVFDPWRAGFVWGALLLSWAMFTARPQEGTWRTYIASVFFPSYFMTPPTTEAPRLQPACSKEADSLDSRSRGSSKPSTELKDT
ncbi:hypothetical protein B0H13DRAFT_1888204 [Mycena leptocephala]|nr:hypothetical protein B0H13DRAFT_1888204 [Mycena leptocephala]